MIGWVIVALFAPFALAFSLVTRRGRSPRARRTALLRYRQPQLPAVIRNVWIVMPVLAGGFIPLVVVTAPATLGLALPPIPMGLQKLLVLGSLSYAFLFFGAVPVLLYHPPRWLVPRWIVEDDRRVGYSPPRPGLVDRAWLLFGLLCLAIGIAVLAVLVAAEVL